MKTLTCYVDCMGDLVTYDTAETLRHATPAERSESSAEGTGTGAFRAQVAERTVRRRAPEYVRMRRAVCREL